MSSRRCGASVIAEQAFGPDRALMLYHFPSALQPAIVALWAIDEAMGKAVAGASQPALAGIKLAWWREALARLDHDRAPPEPRLKAVADRILPHGVSGAEVAGIEEGWAALLDPMPDFERVALRGQRLFAIEANLLGVDDPLLAKAGALFALTDAERRGLGQFAEERFALLDDLRRARIGRAARPITLAARLAARGLDEPEATPGRAFALLRHRFYGKITGLRRAPSSRSCSSPDR